MGGNAVHACRLAIGKHTLGFFTQGCDPLVSTSNGQARTGVIRKHLQYDLSGRQSGSLVSTRNRQAHALVYTQECGSPVSISNGQAQTRVNMQECDSLASTSKGQAHSRVIRKHLHYELSGRQCHLASTHEGLQAGMQFSRVD